MIRKLGKFGILLLVVALAIATVGIATSSQNLCIVSTAQTDETKVIFSEASCTEDPEAEDKDVGSCSVTGQGSDTLTVTLNNTYPGYTCTSDYTLSKTGSIPVKVQSIKINGIAVSPGDTVAIDNAVSVSHTSLAVGASIDSQGSAKGDLRVHVLQSANEGATYSFTVTTEVAEATVSDPPTIKAKWEKFSHYDDSGEKKPARDDYTLEYMTYDDDPTAPGIQVLPPGQDDPQGEIDIEFWAVVTDPQGLADIAFVTADVYKPDGSKKYEVGMLQVYEDYLDPSVKAEAFAEMEAADAASAVTYNINPATGELYTLADLKAQYERNEAWIFQGKEWLDYHQSHGWYTVEVCAADGELHMDYKTNEFEYVKEASIEIDFGTLNFGQVKVGKEVTISGDDDMTTPEAPTVKNLGNCDCQIIVHFDDMGFGYRTENGEQVWNVHYDARLDLFDPVPFIDPCSDTKLPGTLLMCETMKISFSIHVDKAEPGTYNGMMTLRCEPVP